MSTASKTANPATNGAAASSKKQTSGFAVVKAVLSGDLIVVMGALQPDGTYPEKQLALSAVNAPKFARSKQQQDEPFAWESREFLRKRLIGQQVQWNVLYTSETGREFATILHNGENMSHAIVRAGLATVRRPQNSTKLPAELEELVLLEQEAQGQLLGVHSKNNSKKHVRNIEWNPDGAQLVAKYKNVLLDAVVDQVRDGSTLRCEIVDSRVSNGQHVMLNLLLAGVQSPRTLLPFAVLQQQYEAKIAENPAAAASIPKPQETKPEPYALEAQSFTEARLLHRDVQVLLLGTDKTGNVFGSVVFRKGNIAAKLLETGLAKYVAWSAALTNAVEELKQAETLAKLQKLRLHKDSSILDSASESGPAEYTAKVIQVVSGDTLVVQDGKDVERRVTLASIRAPRIGNPKRGDKDENFAQEAKEFLRSRLIGHKVRVVNEYARAAPSESQDKSLRQSVSIFLNQQNVNEALVGAGLAEVVRHRLDEDRSQFYQTYLSAEQAAKEDGKGMYSKKKVAPTRYVDLTEKYVAKDDESESVKNKQVTMKVKQYLPFLQREKRVNAIVEYCFSASRFKVLVPKENCYIPFVLSSVRSPAAKNEDGSDNEYFTKSLSIVKSKILQHNVQIEVEGLDRGDNFIGTLFINKMNLGVHLAQEGLVSVSVASAERNPYGQELIAAQKSAQEAKKNMWTNYVERKQEEKSDDADDDEADNKTQSDGDFVNISITEILDVCTFYCNIVGDKNAEIINDRMATFGENYASVDDYQPEPGTVCAGLFTDDKWYRVRIQSISEDGYRVYFIDFGNYDELQIEHLRPLPEDLAAIPPQARLCFLAGLRGPRDEEYTEGATQAFAEVAFGRQLLGKVEWSERSGRLHLTLMDSASPVSINSHLVRDGWAKSLKRAPFKLSKLVSDLKKDEQYAKEHHYNVWEYGDVSDDEDDRF